MSVVTGNKGEKGTKKFQSLNINNLYQVSFVSIFCPKVKGQQSRSLTIYLLSIQGSATKPQQKSAPQKHGLQSLGKVPTARRAPANLPSLKAEHSGNDPTVTLVPTGAATGGWSGSKEEVDGHKSKPEGINAEPPNLNNHHNASKTANHYHHPGGGGGNLNSAHQTNSQQSKSTWGSVVSKPKEQKNFLSQKSPLFGQEFPSLTSDGSQVSAPPPAQLTPSPPPGSNKSDAIYGPGPSLRPQSYSSWTFGGVGGKQHTDNNNDGSPDPVLPAENNNRTRNLPQAGAPLKFDVGVNSPLLQGVSFPGRKVSAQRSQPVLVNKAPQSSRGRDAIFQGSIIDNEKLKRMDDIDSNDDDWARKDESFDYNKRIAR